MPSLVYVVEDDDSIRDLIQIALQSYSYTVRAFETAEEALGCMKDETPDVALFDIMLPGMDGLTALKQVRQSPKTRHLPVMILTAKGTEVDRVTGLDSGADDYMVKPFSVLELAARVRSLIRRSGYEPAARDGKIEAGSLTIDSKAREVRREGKLVELTFKEFELLKYLAERRDRVATREEILGNVWGYDFYGETRTLDMHVLALRQKLGDDGKYIKTVRGVGYRFSDFKE